MWSPSRWLVLARDRTVSLTVSAHKRTARLGRCKWNSLHPMEGELSILKLGSYAEPGEVRLPVLISL